MDDDDSDPGGFDDMPFDGGDDTLGLPGSDTESDPERTPVPQRKQSLSVRRPSFAQISQEDEDDGQDEQEQLQEEEEVERHMSGKQTKGKARGKPPPEPEDDPPMEDDIARGLEEVEEQPEEDFGQEEQEAGEPSPPRGKTRQRDADDSTERQRQKKKARTENDGADAPKKPRGRPRKENVLREGTLIWTTVAAHTLNLCSRI